MSHNQTILLVDDEMKITEVLAAYLELAGYRVLTALSGTEALNLLWNENPDLIILDYMLPDIEGPELCRRIRNCSDLPVLMLSARVTQEDIYKSLIAGVTDYVIKPISPKALVSKVSEVIHDVSGDRPHSSPMSNVVCN